MLSNGQNLGLLVNGEYGEANYHEFLRLLRALDLLIQPHVKSATTAIPATPAEGDAYIVPTGGTGAWLGKGGKLARYTAYPAAAQFTEDSDGWEFFTPKKGWIVGVDDTNSHVKFDGSAWVAFPA